jgi:signal peptidase I
VARGIELVILLVIAVGIVVAVIAVAGGGWEVQPILSGSMRPGFPVGGVVIAERLPLSELQVRDVIIFHPPFDPSQYYVHRVIALRRVGSTADIRTQGDANLYPDPWTLRLRGRDVYVAQFTLPLLGYAAVWVRSPTGHRIMLVLAVILVGALVVPPLRGRMRRRPGPPREEREE